MEPNCISCDVELAPNAKFCQKCGAPQKCKSCGANAVKNANNCIECGANLLQPQLDSNKGTMNTVKFRQTAKTRSYEVAFSDAVGANIVGVMTNIDTQTASQFKQLVSPKSVDNKNNENKTEDVDSEEVTEEIEETTTTSTNNGEIPHITDVENRLECSEAHWVLVYAFYISNHGNNTFSKDSLLKKYKERRGTASRIANFSNKWKSLFKGIAKVRTVKTNEFKLTDDGKKTAISLITGKLKSSASSSSPGKKSTKSESGNSAETNKKSAKTAAKAVQAEEFDLSKTAKKPSLSDFLAQNEIAENTANRILTIAYYIKTYCKTDSFKEGNIEYAYKVLKLSKRPIHLHQTLINIKNKNLWFEYDESTGTWKLARAGEIYFDDNLAKTK